MEFASTNLPTADLNEQLGSLRAVCDQIRLNTATEPLGPQADAALGLHQRRRKLMMQVVQPDMRAMPPGVSPLSYIDPWLASRVTTAGGVPPCPVSSKELAKKHQKLIAAARRQERMEEEVLHKTVTDETSVLDPKHRKGGNPEDLDTVKFGAEMKRWYFNLIPSLVFLNTGSYGATPKFVLEAREQWEALESEDPLYWRSHVVPFQLRSVVNRLAQFINAHPKDVQLMVNCNTATSTIFKALPWEVGDRILLLSCDYDATKKAATFLEGAFGVVVDYVQVTLPLGDADVLLTLESFFSTRQRSGMPLPVFANFCHVTSKTAWVFPVKEMTAVCHRYGIPVMVDGAQAPGHVKVDVLDIGCEYYCGTMHKWMFTCQGTAFLVVSPSKQPLIDPLAPMSTFGTHYSEAFCQSFTGDFSAFLAIHQAFDFVELVCGGWNQVLSYNRSLALQAVALLEDMWDLHAEGLQCVQSQQMRDVMDSNFNCLPILPLPKSRNAKQSDATTLIGYLLTKYNITAFLFVDRFRLRSGETTDLLCVRLSCNIHVCLADMEQLGKAVKELDGRYGAIAVMRESLPKGVQGMIS